MFNFGRQYMRNMWLSACVCVYWVYIEGFLRLTCRSLYLYVSTSQNQRFPFFISFNSCCYFFFYLETNKAMHFLDGWGSGRWHQAQVGKHPLPTSVSNLTGNLELPKRMINHFFRIILTFFFCTIICFSVISYAPDWACLLLSIDLPSLTFPLSYAVIRPGYVRTAR